MQINVTPQKAQQALNELSRAGQVLFDGENGSFSVRGVEGRFAYDGNSETLTVVIDDRPWLVSQEYVEDKIKEYFTK